MCLYDILIIYDILYRCKRPITIFVFKSFSVRHQPYNCLSYVAKLILTSPTNVFIAKTLERQLIWRLFTKSINRVSKRVGKAADVWERWTFISIKNISYTPCQHRRTDYWDGDTLWTNSSPTEVSTYWSNLVCKECPFHS